MERPETSSKRSARIYSSGPIFVWADSAEGAPNHINDVAAETPQVLMDGDEIGIGGTRLVFFSRRPLARSGTARVCPNHGVLALGQATCPGCIRDWREALRDTDFGRRAV